MKDNLDVLPMYLPFRINKKIIFLSLVYFAIFSLFTMNFESNWNGLA